MRALFAFALALIAACTATAPPLPALPSPSREPGALNVTALLDLSGPARGPSGSAQRDAMQLWADQHANASPRVRVRFVDLAGSPAKAVLELRRAAVDDRADAIVVGVPVTLDDLAAAVKLAAIPVLFTLPLGEPARATGGWAFALAPTPEDLARAIVADASRGPADGGSIVSDESPSAVVERAALVAASAGGRWRVVQLSPSELTARVRVLVAGTEPIVFTGWPKVYFEAARSAKTGPLYFSYLLDPSDLGDLRDAAVLALWPGSRWIASGAPLSNAARAAFLPTYRDRAGPPTTHAASAYDALTLLATAAETGLEPSRVRARLEAGTFAGVASTYSFTATRHAGFALDDLVFLRYAGPRQAPIAR